MLIKIVLLPKMVNQNKNILFNKLNDFIIKYYQNQLIRGGIYVGSISIIFFLLFTIIEYFSGFGVGGRTILFWTYILVNFIVFIKLILIPILNLCKIGNTLNYKEAAKIIGNHFSEIDDQLLNILELSEISKQDTALINASINQKTKIVSRINFKNAIDFSVNKKHLKWILIPLSIILLDENSTISRLVLGFPFLGSNSIDPENNSNSIISCLSRILTSSTKIISLIKGLYNHNHCSDPTIPLSSKHY